MNKKKKMEKKAICNFSGEFLDLLIMNIVYKLLVNVLDVTLKIK